MLKRILALLTLLCGSLLAENPVPSTAIVYQGEKGIGAGKHIVFLASDHEYRAEETCPALARILAKHHGFKCTVVFGVDKEGHIDAGSSNIKGLEALKDADLFFIFARFLNPPDEEMAHIQAYLDKGGPVVGLRTSSHAFKMPDNATYAKHSFRSKVKGHESGFGHQVLGNTWVGHYGKNHTQGTRIQLIPALLKHPILKGVGDRAFTHAGAYVGKAREGFTVLAKSQPLVSMEPDAAPDPTKPPMPCAWTRHYEDKDGDKHRVFHSTQGASQDILDENYRRMIINGALWAMGLEDAIKPDLTIDFVGPYSPSTFSFKGEAKGVKPADLAGWESPIMDEGKKERK